MFWIFVFKRKSQSNNKTATHAAASHNPYGAVWLNCKGILNVTLCHVVSRHRWPRPPPCRCPSRWRTRSCCLSTRRRASLTSPAWRTPSTCSSAACRATNRRASSWPGARVWSSRRTSWCSSVTRCPAFLPPLTWGPRCLGRLGEGRGDAIHYCECSLQLEANSKQDPSFNCRFIHCVGLGAYMWMHGCSNTIRNKKYNWQYMIETKDLNMRSQKKKQHSRQ